MSRKRYTLEKATGLLREAEIALIQWVVVGQIHRQLQYQTSLISGGSNMAVLRSARQDE